MSNFGNVSLSLQSMDFGEENWDLSLLMKLHTRNSVESEILGTGEGQPERLSLSSLVAFEMW